MGAGHSEKQFDLLCKVTKKIICHLEKRLLEGIEKIDRDELRKRVDR